MMHALAEIGLWAISPIHWTLDQKIQALILSVLLFTLGWTMLSEIPKMRRRLSLLSHELKTYSQIQVVNGVQVSHKWSRLEFAFSNTSRRPIKVLSCDADTYSGKPSGRGFFYGEVHELHEGNHSSGLIDFSKEPVEGSDLKTISILDSMKKNHVFYFYGGKERNKWTWRLMRILQIWS